jgi:D-alanyl-D-alanine carboxypeptidase
MLAESFVSFFTMLSVQAADAHAAPLTSLNGLPIARYAPGRPFPPRKKDPLSFGIDVSARAAVVVDVASGESLFEKDAQKTFPVASLTKLMTAMTFLDQRPTMDEEVMLLEEDNALDGKSLFAPKERFSKRELIHALLIGSSNDAANALARTSGGTEAFVKAMNAKASALRMRRANFVDPSGLNPGNRASALDIALAMREALQYPEIRQATELTAITLKGRATGKSYAIKSTNLLLGSYLNKGPYRIIAAKTGSLPEAGFCLAQTTKHEDHEVIAVVLGSDNHFSRFQDMKALTSWAFDTFEWPRKAGVASAR